METSGENETLLVPLLLLLSFESEESSEQVLMLLLLVLIMQIADFIMSSLVLITWRILIDTFNVLDIMTLLLVSLFRSDRDGKLKLLCHRLHF